MVRSNYGILGKLLIILLTILFTLGAVAGSIFLIYKYAKVKTVANLISSDLISESYDGTIEDLVQFIADKALSGDMSLQDLIDISPALGNKLDSVISNLENMGMFKVDREALYRTPVNQLSTTVRSTLIITGTLSNLANTAGFTLPNMPLFTAAEDSPDVYTRANPTGSGAIDREFTMSSFGYTYYSRAAAMRTTYTVSVETGVGEDGAPVMQDETRTVVQWVQKSLFELQNVRSKADGLYYGDSALYLCTTDGTDQQALATYTRLTEKNGAVYSLTLPEDAGEDAPYAAKFALGKEQSIVCKGINTESGAYTAVADLAGGDYTDLQETVSLPEVATPFLYRPLYAQVDTVPEGVSAIEADGKYYLCVNTVGENGKYVLDEDNGGFAIADEYRDGRALYYLDHVYTEVSLEQAQALAAKDAGVYVRTKGVSDLPLTYAISALSALLDKNTMTLDDLGEYFGVQFSDSAVLDNVRDVPFNYLPDAMSPAISNTYLDDVIKLDVNSSRALLFLAYGEEGIGYEIRETVDESSGEVLSRELIVHQRKTVGSVTHATDLMKIGDLIAIDEDSSNLLQAIRDWSLNDFSNADKVDSLTLGQVLDIVTDEEASEGKPASPNILQALADVSLGDMSSAIEDLTIEQVLGTDAVTGDPLLQLLRSSTIGTMADDIKSMTIQELFADSVYDYYEVAQVVGGTIDALRDEYNAQKAIFGEDYLYVKQRNVYTLAKLFIENYQSGAVPDRLYSPYLNVTDIRADYAGVPLYYLREVTVTEGEGASSTQYVMTQATKVTGWSLPALPDGVSEGMLYARKREEDGTFSKDQNGQYIYVAASTVKDDPYYTEGKLYYWNGAADSAKTLTLTPARYELDAAFADGQTKLFSRLQRANTQVGAANALYGQSELYWFDVATQAYARLPLANVYLNSASPADGNYYYYGADGKLYRVGDLPQDGALQPVEGITVTPAYFDDGGTAYYYSEDGTLMRASGGAAGAVDVAPRYAVDRTAEAPDENTPLYSYGEVSGLWKYLLRDANSAIRGYTLQNVGDIVLNMSANVKKATLRELYEDDLISVNPPDGTSVDEVFDKGLSNGKKIGDLTIGEMVLLLYNTI